MESILVADSDVLAVDTVARAAMANGLRVIIAQNGVEALERYVPGLRAKVDHVEAATPRTFRFYTQHQQGASFGTKFEGLQPSMKLSEEIAGLYHAGSVGIIMSGWLGAINYGVIVANEVDSALMSSSSGSSPPDSLAVVNNS